jgi:hypothetical protein
LVDNTKPQKEREKTRKQEREKTRKKERKENKVDSYLLLLLALEQLFLHQVEQADVYHHLLHLQAAAAAVVATLLLHRSDELRQGPEQSGAHRGSNPCQVERAARHDPDC